MPTRTEWNYREDFWSRSVYQEGCLAEVEVPLIGSFVFERATLEDDVLCCPDVMFQMFSRCVPVRPDVTSIMSALLYVMSCDALVWHMSLCSINYYV